MIKKKKDILISCKHDQKRETKEKRSTKAENAKLYYTCKE